jgi:serine/threonine protein kinase
MGEVFLASHERLPMKFVVKVLRPGLISPEAMEQFRLEAMVLAKLQHPNIVQLVDFNWTESGLPFLVTEYLPGHDLAAGFEAQRALGFGHVIALLQQIACGLYAAHCQGVVHHDLKPKNVMVVPCDGRRDIVKLIDFGVSSLAANHTKRGRSRISGTPEFMSPEQAIGRGHEVGPASDQFSLAVIAYLLIAGRLPWAGTNTNDVLYQVVHGAPEPLGGHMPSIDTVLSRGMAKRPAQRYPSTLAFVRALRRAMLADGLLGDSFAAALTARNSDEAAMPSAPDFLEDSAPREAASTATATAGSDWSDERSAGASNAPDASTFADESTVPETAELSDLMNAPERDEHAALPRRAYPPTIRLRPPVPRHGSWRWTPILIGAVLGAVFGLAGPLFAGDSATTWWKKMQAGASQAASVVVDGGRQVLGHLTTRSSK